MRKWGGERGVQCQRRRLGCSERGGEGASKWGSEWGSERVSE